MNLSKREWLAGQALSLAASIPDRDPQDIAQRAVAIADAVIARLTETEPKPEPLPPPTRSGAPKAIPTKFGR